MLSLSIFSSFGQVARKNACHLRVNIPKGNPEGVFVFYHGFRGYALLYKLFFIFLKNAGWYVVSVDFPGHGMNRKKGTPGEFELKEIYGATRQSLLKAVKISKEKNIPIVLAGYSLGGLTLITYLINGRGSAVYRKMIGKQRIIGLLGIGVPFTVRHVVPEWKISLGEWLIRFGLSDLLRYFPIDQANFFEITHDERLAKWATERSSFLVKAPLSASTGLVILNMSQVLTDMKEAFSDLIRLFDGKVYFVRGADDGVAHPHEEIDFVSALIETGYVQTRRYNSVAVKELSEGDEPTRADVLKYRHELLVGEGTEKVRDDIYSWLRGIVSR